MTPANKAESMGEEEQGSSVAESGGTALPKSDVQHTAGPAEIWLVSAKEDGYEPYEWTVCACWTKAEAKALAGAFMLRVEEAQSLAPECPDVDDGDKVWLRYHRSMAKAKALIADIDGGTCGFDFAFYIHNVPIFSPSEASAGTPATAEPPSPPTGLALLKENGDG